MTKVHPMTYVNRGPRLVTPSGAPVPAPKVALGYTFGPISAVFMHSLLALRECETRLHYLIPQGGIYVDHNRNAIVERFLQTDAEWLLQIDTDIEFPPTIVDSLLKIAGSDKHIVAASVPLGWSEQHGRPLPSCGWRAKALPGVWAGIEGDEITAEGIECDGIATAVCLIRREVFEAIAQRDGQCWFLKARVNCLHESKSAAAWASDEGPAQDRKYVPMGEDLAFSIRAYEAGYKCWVAKVEGLRHHKSVPLSHDFEVKNEPAKPVAAVGG